MEYTLSSVYEIKFSQFLYLIIRNYRNFLYSSYLLIMCLDVRNALNFNTQSW